MLEGVLPETARHFARAIIMPNLVPPWSPAMTRAPIATASGRPARGHDFSR
jgi:dihydroorotase